MLIKRALSLATKVLGMLEVKRASQRSHHANYKGIWADLRGTWTSLGMTQGVTLWHLIAAGEGMNVSHGTQIQYILG